MSESVKVEALKTTQWWHYNSFFLAAADAAVSAVSAVVKISSRTFLGSDGKVPPDSSENGA